MAAACSCLAVDGLLAASVARRGGFVDVLALLVVSSVFSLGLVAALVPLQGSARRDGE